MNMRVRFSMFALGLVGMGAFFFGCSAGGTGGNGDGNNDGAGDDRPNPGLNGFFRENEAWTVASPDLLLLGYGDTIEAALLVSANDFECLQQDPGGVVSFDGETLRVDSEFFSEDTNHDCTIQVTADASECQSDGTSTTTTECTLGTGNGKGEFGGQEVEWTQQTVNRFEPCDEIPVDLDNEANWGFLNVHPLLLAFLDDPESIGAVVLVAGQFEQRAATVAFGLEGTEACIDETPTGRFEWDGQTLNVDYALGGNDNQDGVGIEGECRLTFEGTTSYCAVYDPNVLNPGSGNSAPGRLVRIDGNGSYTSPGDQGSFDLLYLLVTEPANNNGGFGGGSGGPRR